MLKKIWKSYRGVSLPIVMSLVVLLMMASAAVNQLIIRSLRSSRQIEASSRAYLAAEAGIEEALYELSGHFAGYETPELLDQNARKNNFTADPGLTWKNRWSIQSHGIGTACANNIDLCGKVNQKRKLNISLFNDGAQGIQSLSVAAFQIRFKIPENIVTNPDHLGVFDNGLVIDNDGDAWVTGKDSGINEDVEGDSGNCMLGNGGNPVASKDADCDGKEDEDKAEDPVIYWKISDGAGKTLTPKRGCLNENDPQKFIGSSLCEKNFQMVGNEVFATLDQTVIGIREDGSEETIANFLAQYDSNKNNKLQIEFLVVAPLEQINLGAQKKLPLPHLEYEITYVADKTMPDPLFLIQSDGFYQDFKQSITTTLTPKTTVPLLDFTVIQQQ